VAIALTAYAPYDSGAGADVTEDTWRQFMRHMRGSAFGDGVLRTASDSFEVYGDSSGMQVKVKAGECWIRGQWGELDAEETLPIAAADSTNDRLDLVVLRNDFVDNTIELDVLTGAPALSPSLPTLTQTTAVWEIPLATVNVTASATSIAAGQVSDSRQWIDDDPYAVRKIADKTVTNNATLSADGELTLPVSRLATYAFETFLIYSVAGAADFKVRPTGPAGASGWVCATGLGFGASSIIGDVELGAFPFGTTLVCGGVGATTEVAALVRGTLVTGATAGALGFEIAQNVQDASTLTLHAGSWARIQRLE
jgi:hypothetical protein